MGSGSGLEERLGRAGCYTYYYGYTKAYTLARSMMMNRLRAAVVTVAILTTMGILLYLSEVDDDEEVEQPEGQGGARLPPHLLRVRVGVRVGIGAEVRARVRLRVRVRVRVKVRVRVGVSSSSATIATSDSSETTAS